MKARAWVEDDWMRDRLAVHLADVGENDVDLYDFAAVAVTRVERSSGQATDVVPMHLTYDMARALYGALASHFGGHPDAATLRKDYEAERARVDLFIAQAVRP